MLREPGRVHCPYLRAIASWKAILYRKELSSCRDKIVSQFEAPLSKANAIDVFKLELTPSNKLALLEEVAEKFQTMNFFLMENCSSQVLLEKKQSVIKEIGEFIRGKKLKITHSDRVNNSHATNLSRKSQQISL